MKTLNDVINAVQHETQLSRSQLSLKIGKSRNYLNTTVKNGLSYEKEQEVIALLLDLVDDEVTMLRNVLADKEETIEAYKSKLSEIITENFNIVSEKDDEIESKNRSISVYADNLKKSNKISHTRWNKIQDLEKEIATKNLFIDGLDMENKGLMDRISKLEKDLKHMERVNNENHKLRSKLQGQIDCNKAVSEANEQLSTKVKDLERTIKSLKSKIQDQLYYHVATRDAVSQEKTIESLAKAGHATGKKLNKEITKNRILTASIIGLVAIFSVYLWVK